MHALARIRAQKICRSPLQYKPLNLADCFAGKRIKNRVCILLPYHISSVRRNRLLKKRRGTQFIKNRVNVRTVAKVTQRIYGISIHAAARFILKK